VFALGIVAGGACIGRFIYWKEAIDDHRLRTLQAGRYVDLLGLLQTDETTKAACILELDLDFYLSTLSSLQPDEDWPRSHDMRPVIRRIVEYRDENPFEDSLAEARGDMTPRAQAGLSLLRETLALPESE
jgi:hypothetical protein